MKKFNKRKVRGIMKGVNALVTVLMILQPVGTPGLLGSYLLADKAIADTGTVAPADQPAAASADTSSTKTDSSSPASPASQDKSKDTTTKNETAASEDSPSGADTTPSSSTPSSTTQTGGTNPAGTASNSADTNSGSQNGTGSANTSPDTTKSGSSGTISPDAASTSQPTTEKNGQICLDSGAKITDSAKSDWDVNGDTAETKNKVELGVKYVFPLDDKVSVTFTCLPKKSADRTTLKIQQIAANTINLPDGVAPAAGYAYDITTAMGNGDFSYDLSLPKPKAKGAEVQYIEKTAEEAVASDVKKDDLQSVDKTKVKTGKDAVTVSALDHFTIFLFTNWPDISSPSSDSGSSSCTGTCDNTTVTVDQNVTVDFNPATPVCNGDADLCNPTVFSYSKVGSDPSQWNAIFNLGASKFLVKSGATITTTQVPNSSNNRKAPGIIINTTCSVEVEDGGYIVVESLNQQAGDISIHADGPITVNGEVRDEVKGTNGLPGQITIASKCGGIQQGKNGFIQDEGIDEGGNNINLLACQQGNIETNGLVMARAHAHGADLTKNRPDINVAAFDGSVTVNGNTTEPLYDEHSYNGGKYDLWGGLLSWVRDNVNPGFVKVQAKNNVIVKGHGDDPTAPVRTSFGAITAIASDVAGGLVDVRSLDGSIAGYDRAFDVSGQNLLSTNFAHNNLLAAGDIYLARPGVNSSFNPVADASSPGAGDKGGKNELRAYLGGILNETNSLISASVPAGSGTVQGTNLLTACTGVVANNGTITPADAISGDDTGTCSPTAPDPLFTIESTLYREGCDFPPETKGSITIVKNTIGGNGTFDFTTTGGLSPASPSITTSANTGSQAYNNLTPGTYSVSETVPAGWNLTDQTCSDESPVNAISLQTGENVTCTFTNTLQQAHLTVIKHIINDNGGTAVAADFTMNITGTNVSDPSFLGAESPGTTVTLDAGSYSVAENGGPTGYAESDSADCSGSIAAGETKTCTIMNDDIQPKLIVIKHVDISHGGTAVASDFTLDSGGTNDSPDNFPGAESSGTTVFLDAGSYGVTETGPSGYDDQYSADCSGSIAIGETKTCTVTNSDQPGTLTVIKKVNNDHGGTAVASNFTMNVTGFNVKPGNSFPGSDSGTSVTLDAGAYSVSESNLPTGYKFVSASAGCSGTMTLGGSATCTITNEDIAPTLTVVKNVVNDNGGNAKVGDFNIEINSNGLSFDPGVTNGSTTTYTAKPSILSNTAYTLTEDPFAGYNKGTWSCVDNDTQQAVSNPATLNEGQNVTCTITNNDQQGTLIVKKVVINDNGGTKIATDFSFKVDGGSATVFLQDGLDNLKGKNTLPVNAATYNVTEDATPVTGYTTTYDNCSDVAVVNGETETCTITNTDQPAHLTVIKNVINDNGGTADASDFEMNVTGTNVSDSSFAGAESPGVTVTLNAGSYSVDENSFAGYTKTIGTDCSGTIANGESKTCTITNDDNAPGLHLRKTVINNNGGTALDTDWTLTATGVLQSPTNLSGSTPVDSGSNFKADTYTLGESGPAGYAASAWSCTGDVQNSGDQITLGLGQSATCMITNDDITGTLKIVKNTVGGDGPFDFTVTGPTASTPSITTVTGTGFAGPTDVNAGTYSVKETIPSDWDLNSAACDDGSSTFAVDTVSGIKVALAQNVVCTFNNTKRGHIIVNKVTDPVQNPQSFAFTTTGTGYAGFSLTGVTGSDSNDQALVPGTYTVAETPLVGWNLTGVTCTGDFEDQQAPDSIVLQAGETVTCTFNNQFIPPGLRIDKSNDAVGAKSPGDSVTYTLVIKAKGIDDNNNLTTNTSNIDNVHVTDLPPDGFAYQAGSWTATSSVRGNIKNSPTTEPTYPTSGPGDWSLGTMVPDEVVTLTYVANISTSQESGTYPDLAWARGADLLNNPVQATKGDPVFFAGTEVAVIRPGQVLGASVDIPTNHKTHHKKKKIKHVTKVSKVLPATGMNPLWPVTGFALLTLGGAMLFIGRDKRRRRFKNMAKSAYKSIFLTILISVLTFAVFGTAKAAVPPGLAANMMTPTPPYNTNDFNLGFVALDIHGNPVTVQCFKKGPTDLSFSVFGTPISLGNGGTSGNCHVTSAVVTGDGTYEFYIVASNGIDPDVTTAPVSLEVITGGPETPTNFNHDRPSACQNIISFTTANDGGKTVRAEIYKSPNTSFNADASTLVTNITGLTSNQPVSYTDIIPSNCQRFFYVVRAFDALGNGSGVVGDTRTVTTTTGGGTTTVTTTVGGGGGGAIPVGGGGAVAGAAAGPGAAAPGGGGAVAGEQAPTPSGGEQPGQVQGAEQEKPQGLGGFISTHKALSAIIALIILGILYYVYFLVQKRRRSSKLPPQTPLAGPPEPPQTPPTS